MRTLSAGDMRRIVDGEERFLLMDVANCTTRGSAVHIPFNDEFLQSVLAYAEPGALPVIIQGDAADTSLVEQAATVLRAGGFLEVWTFFETWPGPPERPVRHRLAGSVFSDPDADDRAKHARQLQRK
jgi:hypothetical protein